ncbi:hypothetical protein D9757_001493 [Collybiopsis confluens]|uniref:Histone acetyltransferase n=1 Tax=Collybiopsis confluens TaxID=2823264 RepID=A0A8H5MFU1_9AGAR|nr:hypothetical protein D9757_001493 [Collybiopsis confluens]
MRAAAPSTAPDSKPPTSIQNGTPVITFGEMQIDPGLIGPEDEEPLHVEPNGKIQEIYHPQQDLQFFPIDSDQYSQDYPQGPQGDPFAPLPAVFFPPPSLDHPFPATQKAMKRKRKQKKCEICGGNETKNNEGQPEGMFSCIDCEISSGHLSCLRMKYINLDPLRWKCATCKSCEICGGKDNDSDLLLCDGCDRGWHRSCFDPPMDDTPEGDWFCSGCIMLEQQTPDSQLFDTINGHYMPPPPSTLNLCVFLSITTKIIQDDSGTAKKRETSQTKTSPPPAADKNFEATVEANSTTPLKRTRTKPQLQTIKKADLSDDELATPTARQPKRMRIRMQSPVQLPPPIPKVRIRLTQKGKGKGKGKEREEEESKGLFDEVLGEPERDTSKTIILPSDKQRFDKSRAIAEGKLVPLHPPRLSENAEDEPVAGPSRPLRSSNINHLPFSASSNSPAPSTPGGPTQHDTGPASLRIRSIRFGAFEIKTWYDAPFPEEYANIPDGRLWICEFCLKYMKSKFGAVRHQMKCKAKHPPGDEIYRDGTVSIFEVDGRKNKIYCQNLCLLSKMYLDHKSLFYDVEPFLFYVMTEVDDTGARFVGYFSKEKRSPKDYNVSCIMTLPVRQRQGWGNLLIDFSYLLSKKEQRTGSPEKPLSALGALGYKNYWTLSIMRYLETAPENPRLEDISVATSMTVEDIYNTLVQQNMITARPATPPSVRPSPGQSIKYIKGRQRGGVARRHLQRSLTNTSQSEDNTNSSGNNNQLGDSHQHHQHQVPNEPFVPPKEYDIVWDPEVVRTYMTNWEQKGYLRLRGEKLKWSPFLLVKAGAGGEVGVVKKTEAKGAVGTGGGGGETKLSALETNGLLLEGALRPETETPTPLSLFDDDDVVNAAEMELPNLSTVLIGQSTKTDNATLANGRVSDSVRNASLEEPDSPSPNGRKRRTKDRNASVTSRSDSLEVIVNGSNTAEEPAMASSPHLISVGSLESSTDSSEVVHLFGAEIKNDEEEEEEEPDKPVVLATKRKGRPSKKGKKQGKGIKEGNQRLEEDGVGGDVEDDAYGDGSELTVAPAKIPITRLRTRSSQKSSTSSSPFLLVDSPISTTLPWPRQLRTRTISADDIGLLPGTPVRGELKKTGSVNGRRLASQRKRRRVESSPEMELDLVSESVPVSVSAMPVGDTSDTEEATAATSLLSLLHSEPVVFQSNGDNHAYEQEAHRTEGDLERGLVKVEGEDTGYSEMNVVGRHIIPSDVTVFGNDMQAVGVTLEKQMDVDVDMANASLTVQQEDEDGDPDADGSADSDDGEYDIDDALE